MQEFRNKKRDEDEARMRAAAQENILRNFAKKPNLGSGQNNSNDDQEDGSFFGRVRTMKDAFGQ